jgi:hypothetical protein
MRWRLFRRRLSISSPRMSVRSHLPWPLRWAALAVALGFSGALALWAFEIGKGLAGLNHDRGDAAQALTQAREQMEDMKRDREHAQSIANTADSLLRTERATQLRLAEQVKALEMENQALKDDLGFFERLLPASGEGLSVRGLQATTPAPGQLRFQLLVMQQGGRTQSEFKGRYEVVISGSLDGKAWAPATPVVTKAVQVRQYLRLDGLAEFPAAAVVKLVQVRVLDEQGHLHATQSLKF